MVEVITPPSSLADRVVKGVGPDLQTIMARVEAGMETLKHQYSDVLSSDLAALDKALEKIKAETGELPTEAATELYQAAHEIRGLAGSFDYPLLTGIAGSLCGFIDQLDSDLRPHIRVIELQVGAMHAVVANKITGGGGRQGRELVASIGDLVTKALAEAGLDR